MNLPSYVKDNINYSSQFIYDICYTFETLYDEGIVEIVAPLKCSKLKDERGNVYNREKGFDKFYFYSCVLEEGDGYLLFPLTDGKFFRVKFEIQK